MKITNIKTVRAFSLAEVLITLIIVSVLMIVLAPAITKSMIKPKGDGIVYVYSPENNTEKDDVCFLTVPTYASGAVQNEEYTSTTTCSEYEFKVPDNVNSINLTLVAGGGGGGGASGGISKITNLNLGGFGLSSESIENKFIGHLIKSIKINALVGKGVDGKGSSVLTGEDLGGGATGTPNAGTGGKSSSALFGLMIPSKLMKGVGYTPKNTNELDVTTKLTINTNSASILISNSNTNSEVVYSVPFQSDAQENILQPTCKAGGTTLDLVYDCGATKDNYFTGAMGTGKDGFSTAPTEGTVQLNNIVWGGEGGKIPQMPTGYGWGGKNSDYILSKCDGTSSQSCAQSNDMAYTKMNTETKAGAAYASITVTTETPGVPGGGGAGGNAMRIKDFAVTPGDTYIIRVGKGGAGGRAGALSSIPSNTQAVDGEGGTSTAIYKKTGELETLVLMVNGGAGGLSNGYNTENNYTTQAVASGRTRPAAFTQTLDFASISADETVGATVSEISSEAPKPVSSWNSAYLKYSFYSKVPFDYLAYLRNYASNTVWSDKALGGHSAFNTQNIECKPNGNETILCGAVLRLESNGSYIYTGGLGGFSGLGSKAGCGGYFVGNNVVNKTEVETAAPGGGTVKVPVYKVVRANRFYTPDNLGSGVLNGSEEVSAFDIYDNCTIENPNGQSATYVAPDALKLKFGSAGAGGGGGGYSLEKGAGAGGDGQDGYLMIDWRK